MDDKKKKKQLKLSILYSFEVKDVIAVHIDIPFPID